MQSLNGWGQRSVQVTQAEPDQNIFSRYYQHQADSSIPSTLLFESSRKSSHLTLNINQFQDDLVSAEPMLPLHYYIQRNPCKTSSFAFPVPRSNHPINITLFKLNNSGKHWSQFTASEKWVNVSISELYTTEHSKDLATQSWHLIWSAGWGCLNRETYFLSAKPRKRAHLLHCSLLRSCELKVQDKVLSITMESISSTVRYTETFRF